VNLGRVPERFAEGKGIFDVQPLEWWSWAPLLALIVVAGLFPKMMLDVTDGAVQVLVRPFVGG
jgi:NADH-quinone oxidoreductase subunit M